MTISRGLLGPAQAFLFLGVFLLVQAPNPAAGQMLPSAVADTPAPFQVPPPQHPSFLVEWNILPAFFGLWEAQVEKPLTSLFGFRASFGIFDGLFEGETMTSDYQAFGGSLGFRWYPSTTRPGFFVEEGIRADRLSWTLTFFPPTGPPTFPDPSGPEEGPAQLPSFSQVFAQQPETPEPTEASDWSASLDSMVGYRWIWGRVVFALSGGVGITLLKPDAEKGGEPPLFVQESESYQDFLDDFNGRYDTLEPRVGLSLGFVFR